MSQALCKFALPFYEGLKNSNSILWPPQQFASRFYEGLQKCASPLYERLKTNMLPAYEGMNNAHLPFTSASKICITILYITKNVQTYICAYLYSPRWVSPALSSICIKILWWSQNMHVHFMSVSKIYTTIMKVWQIRMCILWAPSQMSVERAKSANSLRLSANIIKKCK